MRLLVFFHIRNLHRSRYRIRKEKKSSKSSLKHSSSHPKWDHCCSHSAQLLLILMWQGSSRSFFISIDSLSSRHISNSKREWQRKSRCENSKQRRIHVEKSSLYSAIISDEPTLKLNGLRAQYQQQSQHAIQSAVGQISSITSDDLRMSREVQELKLFPARKTIRRAVEWKIRRINKWVSQFATARNLLSSVESIFHCVCRTLLSVHRQIKPWCWLALLLMGFIELHPTLMECTNERRARESVRVEIFRKNC